MRLYILLFFVLLLLSACAPAVAPAEAISVTISFDGDSRSLTLPAGSRVRDAIASAAIELGDLDRSEPPSYTELTDGDEVRVIRVTEEFETEQSTLPFISRTLPNESLPVGEQRLVQNGANGLREVHYRLLFEDGELVSRTEVDSAVLTQPVEEIIMIGAQSTFSSVELSGRLAFLSAGNAWVLERSSGSRRAVAITGDLDGRIFEVSPNGEWLLFSRTSSSDGDINELWVARLDEGDQFLIDLNVSNVVHYAGWVPGDEYQVAFSTVEPSPNPPGWQANNDLQSLTFTDAGQVAELEILLSPREDGFYAWWGTSYASSPSGEQLAFSRPDGVGTVNLDSDSLDVWFTLPAFQTGSDWAWIPGLSWLDDDSFYYVRYALNPPSFALVLTGPGGSTQIAADVGMFAYPAAEQDGGQVAFLRAFIPAQSDISTYELMVATSEGVTASLFPPEGAAGLQPHQVAWSPSAESGPMIAFVYEGNLWVVNVLTGQAQQLTGDGLVSRLSWR
ncbi:MAG: G5 domain-containing protein [Anaerolineales bacterium]